MKTFLFILSCLFVFIQSYAQDSLGHSFSEESAKRAVFNIVRYSGLPPNFIVRENASIKTAHAFIHKDQRWIEYNPSFLAQVNDSSNTDWSAISVLAHEIGHHLMGHTLNPRKYGPGDELECDRYSGFILANMGASLEDALAAISLSGSEEASKTHPAKMARIQAITLGYNSALILDDSPPLHIQDDRFEYTHSIHFEGDPNTYYFTKVMSIVWLDEYAQAVEFGTVEVHPKPSYEYRFQFDDNWFHVDFKGQIWSITQYGVFMNIGKCKPL